MIRIKVTEAKSTFAKVRGLLGTKRPFSLLLHTRFGIHTFGMRYPIDVVILDDSRRVKAIKPNLLPNRVFVWNPVYQHVLELPLGTIKKEKIVIGATVQLAYERSSSL